MSIDKLIVTLTLVHLLFITFCKQFDFILKNKGNIYSNLIACLKLVYYVLAANPSTATSTK